MPSHCTRAQAARILKTSVNGIIYKIRTGKLTAEKHWGTVMIPMRDIIRALDEKEADNVWPDAPRRPARHRGRMARRVVTLHDMGTLETTPGESYATDNLRKLFVASPALEPAP